MFLLFDFAGPAPLAAVPFWTHEIKRGKTWLTKQHDAELGPAARDLARLGTATSITAPLYA